MAIQPAGAKITARQVYRYHKEAIDAQVDAQNESAIDCEYYDNKQWAAKDKQTLKERGQPEVTFNRLKGSIDVVLGTETRVRVDFKAKPRTGLHVEDANVVTHLMKHVMDESQGEYQLSDAFANQTKAGWGWIEVKKNTDPFESPVVIECIDRRFVFWDPFSKRYDLKDAKYVGRVKWVDIEDAVALYPEYKEALEQAISDERDEIGFRMPYEPTGDEEGDIHGTVFDWADADKGIHAKDWIDGKKRRVKLIEIWYKVPEQILMLEDSNTGEKREFDPKEIGALGAVMQPGVDVYRRTVQKVRVAMVAGPNLLEDNPSPYSHNRYPFVPFWAYRKDKTLEPFGLARQMRSPQDEINKRRSKALHILNTARVIADADAFDGNEIEEIRKEVARPDAVILKKRPDALLEIETETQLAEAQFKLMMTAMEEISMAVPLELMGQETNAQSGKAINARIYQGNTLLATLFDNYRRSRQLVGELMFSLIQQFYTTPLVVRTVDESGEYEFITINQREMMEDGRVLIRNDISQARVDIKIDEEAFHASLRESILEQMIELVGKLPPEFAVMLLDLVIAQTDIPGRDDMVKRIQAIQQAMGAGGVTQQGDESAGATA